MKLLFSIRFLIYACIIASLNSCSANWFGDIWHKFPDNRLESAIYSKEVYSIKDAEYSKYMNLDYRQIYFRGFSYFNALNKKNNKFKIYEKDIILVEKIELIISDELKKSLRSISKNKELLFHLDNKLVDNGLSTFRKDLITHDELIKYTPISNEDVNVFFAIAEISQDDYCVFINSTSVQMFVYDKDEIIYKNAVGILNGYHINLDDFISKREEDIKLAVGSLLDSFNKAYY